jgi:hypothetical protein
MLPKNVAEMRINRTRAMTAITGEDRETGRHGEERLPKTGILLNLLPGGTPGSKRLL